MKKSVAVFLLFLTLFSLASCGGDSVKELQFTHEDGFSITLTEAFREDSNTDYTASYISKDVSVFVLKEPFTKLEGFGDYSLAQYGEMLRAANDNGTATELYAIDDITVFEYSFYNKEENLEYKYFNAIFKGDGAFWCVQFACLKADYALYKPDFTEYAKSFMIQ
ncbi:MAG: hypothetical protein IKK70_04200 [Clostridia bacterium]|nr:hypothetical protein [Clostridia bacterium]